MKKVIMVLFLATVILGLTACGDASEHQDYHAQTEVVEQRDAGISGGNIDTNANPNINEQDLLQEQLLGNIQVIDGMNITISTAQHQHMIFNEPRAGQHFVSPGTTENEPKEITIRLTEQTAIEVSEMRTTSGGGQIADMRDGTLDDLTPQAFVMAEGEWQDDEFVATSLIIMSR